MKIGAIVQARMGSTRLPNKVMKPINGVPMIELLLNRLSHSKELDQIIVATSTDERNIPLVEHVISCGYKCEQGDETNVLKRYISAGKKHQIDVIVRITGDCPLVDPELVDECIRRFKIKQVDYFSNISPATYPDGLDIEVFTLAALEKVMLETKDPFDQEHVTPYILNTDRFNKASMVNHKDLSSLRWTVDELDDFRVITDVFMHFSPDIHFRKKCSPCRNCQLWPETILH